MKMNNLSLKFSLYINYFVFAILLNSVGIVILKAQNVYGVNEVQASSLEAFKDLSIAIVSFLTASFLPKIGFKKAMLTGLIIVVLACLMMYFLNSFTGAKFLFMFIGISFALVKISVYSLIGKLTNNQREHSSLMSNIEGVFMIGIAFAYFLFPYFNSINDDDSWLNVYLFLALLSFISFLFLLKVSFKDNVFLSPNEIKLYTPSENNFFHQFQLMFKKLSLLFAISAFLFVMVEQGIMSWLPTFNEKVLKLPENVSIMMASLLAFSLAVGRILAGYISKKVNWLLIVSTCITMAMLLVIFVLPKTVNLKVEAINSMTDIPLIAFVFPIVGLFIAPIYPLLNSVVLSSIHSKDHSSMTGLIVIFSALGGTLGSRIIGWMFQYYGAQDAFYFTILPMLFLLILFFLLNKITKST